MEDKTVYIYGLTDASGNVRYVGQSVLPWVRYDQHLAEEADTPKGRWIRQMLAKGNKPGLVILDKTDKANARYVEMWWIVLGRQKEWRLTNAVNPTWKSPAFGDMFTQHLRDDFDNFIAEHQPVFIVTQKHKEQATFYLRIILGLLIGLTMAWNVYYFESSIAPHSMIAVFYAFVVFVVAGYAGFFWALDEFKQKGGIRLIVTCASPLLLIATNIAIWAMGWARY